MSYIAIPALGSRGLDDSIGWRGLREGGVIDSWEKMMFCIVPQNGKYCFGMTGLGEERREHYESDRERQ